MYFPDIMSRLFKKNPEFETNAKWIIRFTADAKLVNEEKTAEIISLVSLCLVYIFGLLKNKEKFNMLTGYYFILF